MLWVLLIGISRSGWYRDVAGVKQGYHDHGITKRLECHGCDSWGYYDRKTWNSVNESIKSAPSTSNFKYELIKSRILIKIAFLVKFLIFFLIYCNI